MKTEITILFTDTHYGIKNNSMTWLKSQMDFIYKQLLPYIKDQQKSHSIRLIHLGDVFDSRSSISTMVASTVVKAFGELRSNVDSFYIIAGNHDFYSPTSDSVNTLSLLFDQMDITLVIDKIVQDGTDIMVPWYEWGEPEIQDMIDNGIKRIFTHTDIVTKLPIYRHVKIYSGHEHIPMIKENIGLYNLGACYALDFADSNHHRGFWVLDENDELKMEPNMYSIRFWRLYNDDIFSNHVLNMLKKNDYIEVYISQKNMIKDEFIQTINVLSQTYKNIWIIPQNDEVIDNNMEKFEGYNIIDMTKAMIPDELKEKFELVLKTNQKSIIME